MPEDNTYRPLVEAVEAVIGIRMSLPTVLRWATKPRKGHLLRTILIGGRRYSTAEWVREYIEGINNASSQESGFTPATLPTPDTLATPRQAERSADRAAKQLRKRLSKTK